MELSAWHLWWKREGAAGVRLALMNEWDPIGVRGMPEAADEYDRYVGVVGAMLREGSGADAIAHYLTTVRVERMGLGPGEARADQERSVAARLVEVWR